MRPLFFKNSKGLWLAVLIAAGLGCTPRPKVPLINELQGSGDYFKEVTRNTQSHRSYSELELRFVVYVTYLSRPLLRAYVAEYAHTYKLSPVEQRNLLQETLAKAEKEEAFFIGIYAPGKNWDRFDMTDHIWKLRAGFNGEEPSLAPIGVEKQPSTNPQVGYFFPYVRQWSKNYRVTFPIRAEAQKIAFEMNGVVGHANFNWPWQP